MDIFYTISWKFLVHFFRPFYLAYGYFQKNNSNKSSVWPILKENTGKKINSNITWIHLASYGEFKGCLAMLVALPFKNHTYVITVTSRKGFQKIRQEWGETLQNPSIILQLAPWPTPKNLSKFWGLEKPQSLVFYEGDLWPGYIKWAHTNKIRVLGVSMRWGKQTQRISQWFPSLLRWQINNMQVIQTQCYSDIAKWEGLYLNTSCIHKPRILAGIDYKAFLGIHKESLVNEAKSLSNSSENIPSSQRPYLSFVSIHYSEITSLKPVILRLQLKYKVLLIPRFLSELPKFYQSLHGKCRPFQEDSHLENGIYIYENWGGVSHLLQKTWFAIVGGSFNRFGGHNVWEPFWLGCITCIGPSYENQQASLECLIPLGGVRVVTSPLELISLSESSGGSQSENQKKIELFQLMQESLKTTQSLLE